MIQTLSLHVVLESIFEEDQEAGAGRGWGGEGGLPMWNGCNGGSQVSLRIHIRMNKTLSPRGVFGPLVEGRQGVWDEQEGAGGCCAGPLGAAKHDPSGLTRSRVPKQRAFGAHKCKTPGLTVCAGRAVSQHRSERLAPNCLPDI